MSITVIGATGHLGRHVVESLLDRGVDPAAITATGRAVERLDDLAERGVRVQRVDLDDPAAVAGAVAGAEQVLLVSGMDPQRVTQHGTVIDAAVAAGVRHLAYTSGPYASTSRLLLMADHAATEELLAAAPLTTTVLRNAWYVENYTAQVETYLAHGMVGAAGSGRVSVAPRREYAEAAAAVLLDESRQGRRYELGGPAVTLPEVAAAISAVTGQQIGYTDLPVAELQQVLAGAGLPAPLDAIFADVDRGIAEGELLVPVDDLESLLGRPATGLEQAVKEALA